MKMDSPKDRMPFSDQLFQVELPGADQWRETICCQDACPVHTDARGYVTAISEGDFERAYIIARGPNPFASICGRVCAAPCEAACRRGKIDAPVAIRALKRFVTERYGVEAYLPSGKEGQGDYHKGLQSLRDLRFQPPTRTIHDFTVLESAWQKAKRARATGKKVAVIGSGVSGMSCAHDLALLGYEVTVFEKQEVAGGMLMLGVPEYRLPRDLVQAEIQAILALGVRLQTGQAIGRDFMLSDLRDQGFEAVFIAIGAHLSRNLPIEGNDADGVLRAVEFLLNANLGFRVELGERVVVIGGGNVAMDAARVAARVAGQAGAAGGTEDGTEDAVIMREMMDVAREAMRVGAREVKVVCLESWDEMPASSFEIEEALSENVLIEPRVGPLRVVVENGRATGLEVHSCIRVFDEEGRFNPQFEAGSNRVIPCDSVIFAIGQASDLSWIREEDGIEISPRGTIQIDPETLGTTAPGIYAGGDVAHGPRIFIEGVENGHRAARSIHTYLSGGRVSVRTQQQWSSVEPLRQVLLGEKGETFSLPVIHPGYQNVPRCEPKALPMDRRIGIAEVELGYDPEDASEQGLRCLRCSANPIFDGAKCILCGGCVDVCPSRCLRMVPLEMLRGGEDVAALIDLRYGASAEEVGVEERGAAMIMDPEKCIRCSLCAQRCPTGAVTIENFSFQEEWVEHE
jgi:NADPH-dependent glutamate synthase beta subunit-like oxidoreductase